MKLSHESTAFSHLDSWTYSPYCDAPTKSSTISIPPFSSLVAFSLSLSLSPFLHHPFPFLPSFRSTNNTHAHTWTSESRDERYDQISKRAKTFETPALLEMRSLGPFLARSLLSSPPPFFPDAGYRLSLCVIIIIPPPLSRRLTRCVIVTFKHSARPYSVFSPKSSVLSSL